MKKTFYFVCLLLSVLSLAGCSRIINMIEVEKEKIGNEHTIYEDNSVVKGDKYRVATNYKGNLNEGVWTIAFDYMNGTEYQNFTIKSDDVLRINSKVNSGEVWIKITQGDLSLSEIQKVQAINEKETTIDLSQWQDGEIFIWLVVEKGEDGLLQIEHIEN